jgi:hypothetical protein
MQTESAVASMSGPSLILSGSQKNRSRRSTRAFLCEPFSICSTTLKQLKLFIEDSELFALAEQALEGVQWALRSTKGVRFA